MADDCIRVNAEDMKRLLEERDHLRQQVTALQEKCNSMLEEIRSMRRCLDAAGISAS
jgi:hypothetical protein